MTKPSGWSGGHFLCIGFVLFDDGTDGFEDVGLQVLDAARLLVEDGVVAGGADELSDEIDHNLRVLVVILGEREQII